MIYAVRKDENGIKSIIHDCHRYREDTCLGQRCQKYDRCMLHEEDD